MRTQNVGKRNHSKYTVVTDQLTGQGVNLVNEARQAAEAAQLELQDLAMLRASEQIEKVRYFIGTPENILGNAATKHGEIAEQVEVGVRNARSALEQQDMTATFDGIGRTAPADYMIDGIQVQSKYINGMNNSLDHVIKHMEKYDNFGRDGSYYHIPKNQHEVIDRILSGEDVEGISDRTANIIRAKAHEIEKFTGKPFGEVVQAGESEYAAVQQGRVHETLDKHEQELRDRNAQRKDEIHQEYEPSLADGLKAAGVGAAVGAGISIGTTLYRKYKEGKNVFQGEFTEKDWKELGLDAGKATLIGGVTGGAIYYITNYMDTSAPAASAFVSAAKGVGSLLNDLHKGNIEPKEFACLALITCAESAMVYAGTLVGQNLIPIPVLGALIGSIAGRMVSDFLIGDDQVLATQMQAEMDSYIKQLDFEFQEIINRINSEFDKLGHLTETAFDLSLNVSLLSRSVELAEGYGVPSEKIIRNYNDLDDFMLG